MKKCLKISFRSYNGGKDVQDFVQRNARDLRIEGTVQIIDPDIVSIFACGIKENIDTFLDILHEGFGDRVPEHIDVEPFLKDKDYRGIFRILE